MFAVSGILFHKDEDEGHHQPLRKTHASVGCVWVYVRALSSTLSLPLIGLSGLSVCVSPFQSLTHLNLKIPYSFLTVFSPLTCSH